MQIILRQHWTERKRVSSRCAKRQRITRTGGALTVCIHTESLLGNGNCNLSLELVSSPTLYPMLYCVISHILHHPLITLPMCMSSLSQLISCWMNTVMFVSLTSAWPATFPRRSPTPACKFI